MTGIERRETIDTGRILLASPAECVVVYHKDCFDGMMAATVVNLWLKKYGQFGTFWPVGYGDPALTPNIFNDKKVIFVDFTYRRELMESIKEVAKHLVVLDHHKTAEADLTNFNGGFPYTVFDMERSGCGIAWDYFFPTILRPWVVNTVEDRDLWRMVLPETREAMAWIATLSFSLDDYEALITHAEKEEVVDMGRAILRYITNYGAKAAEHMRIESIGGYQVPTVNMSYQNCSDHLDQLRNRRPEFPFVASYFRRADGQWQFSLRSAGFDVSAIAKLYGGGGHNNAAGFNVVTLPWEEK